MKKVIDTKKIIEMEIRSIKDITYRKINHNAKLSMNDCISHYIIKTHVRNFTNLGGKYNKNGDFITINTFIKNEQMKEHALNDGIIELQLSLKQIPRNFFNF